MKMWTIMILMTLLYIPAYTIAESNPCETLNGNTLIWSKFNNCSQVILRNKSITAIETSQESHYDKLKKLDISDNNLKRLPEDFLSNSVCLEDVHLGDNSLQRLPEMFLINSSSLKMLRLEVNPLLEVPASVFHATLVNLTIDCRCELVSNILMHLNGNATKYPKLSAMCQMSSEWMNLKDFYTENCGKPKYLALYIVLPILVIGLITGGVALYMWKWKRSSTSLESKGATDKSPAHVQQRYMSRNTEGIESTLSPHQRQDYENVFVDHLRATETKSYGYKGNEHKPSTHSKHTAEEDIYLESEINDGDQPIYTNTQGIYYNYSEPSFKEGKNKEEDDVYILPDQ